MAIGMEVSLDPGHIVPDGDLAHVPQKGGQSPPPIFGPFLFGQTAVCTRIPLGTEVGLNLRDTVLDGDPAPPSKGVEPPIFGQCPLWPNGWMD